MGDRCTVRAGGTDLAQPVVGLDRHTTGSRHRGSSFRSACDGTRVDPGGLDVVGGPPGRTVRLSTTGIGQRVIAVGGSQVREVDVTLPVAHQVHVHFVTLAGDAASLRVLPEHLPHNPLIHWWMRQDEVC